MPVFVLDILHITTYQNHSSVMDTHHVVGILGAAVALSIFLPLVIGYMLD